MGGVGVEHLGRQLVPLPVGFRQIQPLDQGPDFLSLLPDVVEHPLEEAEDHLVLVHVPAHFVLGHQEFFRQVVLVPHLDPEGGLPEVFRVPDQVLESVGADSLDLFRPVHHFGGFQSMPAVGLEIPVVFLIHLEDLLCQGQLRQEILEPVPAVRAGALRGFIPQKRRLVGVDVFHHGLQVFLLLGRLDQYWQQVRVPGLSRLLPFLEGDFEFHQPHMVGKDIVGKQDHVPAAVPETVEGLPVKGDPCPCAVPVSRQFQVVVEVFPHPLVTGGGQHPFRRMGTGLPGHRQGQDFSVLFPETDELFHGHLNGRTGRTSSAGSPTGGSGPAGPHSGPSGCLHSRPGTGSAIFRIPPRCR